MKIINKIKSKLLILSVGVSTGLLIPFFAHAAYLDWWTSFKNGTSKAFAGALLGAINFVLLMVFTLAGKCLAWAGLILDFAIEISIQDSGLYSGGIARFGWELCRDMTNFIFVFALIFIGIATILQVQTYGFRKLLVGVILAALLVNFSATITLVIVDASNLISTEFLCAATAGTCDAKLVSAIIGNALQFQTIVANKDGTVDVETLDPDKQALIYLFGTGLMFLVAFIFIAGAFMFLSRAFIIIFLLIFAPFAFVGTALKMSSARQWWTKLFNQAISPVVYFFLFYLVVYYLTDMKDLTRGGVSAATNTTNRTFHDMVTGSDPLDYALIANFIVMGGLLFGILIISQQLGAMGSAGAIKMIRGGARKMGGYAGRITKAAPRRAAKLAGAGAVAGAAATARKMNLSERIMPVATRQNAWIKEKLTGLERGGTKKGQERTKKQVERGLGLAPKDRAEYLKTSNSAVQKEMFNKMSARDRADMKRQNKSTGFDQVYNKLKKDLSPEEQEKTGKEEATLQKKADIAKLKENRNDTDTAQDLKKVWQTATGDDVKNMVNDTSRDGQKAAKKYFDSLGKLGDTNEDIAKKLELMGNKAQASWLRSSAATPVLKTYGVGGESTPTPPPTPPTPPTPPPSPPAPPTEPLEEQPAPEAGP